MLSAKCSGRMADVNCFHLVEFNSSPFFLFSFLFFFFLSLVEIENEIFTHSIPNLPYPEAKGGDHKFFPHYSFRSNILVTYICECIMLSVWDILASLFDSNSWQMRTFWRPFKVWCPWVRLRDRWLLCVEIGLYFYWRPWK